MHDPQNVFDDPHKYWAFITSPNDNDFEGQHFDRKEAGTLDKSGGVTRNSVNKLREHVQETVSAFANRNVEGGLLILGISTTGVVTGVDRLTEDQLNDITNIRNFLKNQTATVKNYPCPDHTGKANHICLIFASYSDGICETTEAVPKAWERHSSQNIPLNHEQRERLRREKGLTNFERQICCKFDPDDIDQGVLQDYRQTHSSADNTLSQSDEQFLYQIGALKKKDDKYFFTNAGFLFFSQNPQRELDWAKVRFLQFPIPVSQYNNRRLTTKDEFFVGSIVKQLRRIRDFVHTSGFFKVYERRNPHGNGFLKEPELPQDAIDEAIVNAIIHRDYEIARPIECIHYTDAFVVLSPGRVQQRDFDVPKKFSLADQQLVHTTRNSKLFDWLHKMRTTEGTPEFVRGIGEGTRAMQQAMTDLGLPPPLYENLRTQTVVTLVSNAPLREKQYQNELNLADVTEFTNLFPLDLKQDDGLPLEGKDADFQMQEFTQAFRDALVGNGWFVDYARYSRVIAHQQGVEIRVPANVASVVRLYPAYSFQLKSYWGKYYLAIDYTLEVKNIQTANKLIGQLDESHIEGYRGIANWNGWQHCRIVSITPDVSKVYLFDFKQEVQVPSNKVIPNLSKDLLAQLLQQNGVSFDLHKATKEHSLSSRPGEARTRFSKIQQIVQIVADYIFPVSINNLVFRLSPQATPLLRARHQKSDIQVRTLPEPKVAFHRQQETTDIRDGITKFGAYERQEKTIEIVPICLTNVRDQMGALIQRLQTGQYKYRGAERTFSTRLQYHTIITAQTPEQVVTECQRLLKERPEWVGNQELNRIFLVHTPEAGYAFDDESSPYYRTKRLLFENGIPCQMVDTPTIQNPDWKDLNLALNIVAKCGITPWVLPQGLPDADFFIGLSYTRSERQGIQRLMGHANVFDPFGQWQFHSGNTDTFDYDKRNQYFYELTRNTLNRLEKSLSKTPSIYFHYSARFSHEDREAILKAARSIRPDGKYTFVWINTGHNIRLYDTRPQTDGSLSRGSYIITSPYQTYLSTTGYNPFQKTLGTPKPLEINTWQYQTKKDDRKPDLKAIAQQILSLTKLNWSSTGSLCAEPITTKYAGNIAYLTAAFLRQGNPLKLHPVLEETPWFI